MPELDTESANGATTEEELSPMVARVCGDLENNVKPIKHQLLVTIYLESQKIQLLKHHILHFLY